MIPNKIVLRNFLCFRNEHTLDLSNVSVACLTGENGAGKSSILDALTWCLWGRARGSERRGRSQEELINYACEDMSVEVTFSARGEEWCVSRKLSRRRKASSMTELTLYQVDSEQITTAAADRVADVQQAIEDLIGIDYDTFINSAMILQGRADEFTNKTPDQRKAVLASILGLSDYDGLQAQARDAGKQARAKVQGFEGTVATLGGVLERRTETRRELEVEEVNLGEVVHVRGIQLATLQEAQAVVAREAGRVERRRELEGLIRAASGNRGQITADLVGEKFERDRLKDGIGAWDEKVAQEQVNKLADAREKAEGNLQTDRQLLELNAQLNDVAVLSGNLGQQIANGGASIESLRQSRDILGRHHEAECPLCKTVLTPDAKAALVSQMQADIERLEAEIEGAHERFVKLNQESDTVADRRNSRTRFLQAELATVSRSLASAQAEFASSRARVVDAKARLPRIAQQIDALQARFLQADQQIADLNQQLEALGQATKGDNAEILCQAEDAFRDADVELRRVQSSVDVKRAFLQETENAPGQLDEVRSSMKEANLAIESYDFLATAFGRSGIQAMIIEGILPTIEEHANDLLARMTEGRMHLTLSTQREAKTTGKTVESLEIEIADEHGIRAYEMFSGGEAFRINLALRVALSQVLAARRNASVPLLFVDEGFGTQDTAGRGMVVAAIQAIQDQFERIVVISHIDDVQEAFPVRIVVEKNSETSTIEVR